MVDNFLVGFAVMTASISLIHCVPLNESGAEMSVANVEKRRNFNGPLPEGSVLDINDIKKDDFVIRVSSELIPSYRLVPKPNVVITQVNFGETVIWKNHDWVTFSDIIIYYLLKAPYDIILNVVDASGLKNSIHFRNLMILNSYGMIKAYHLIHMEIFNFHSNLKAYPFDLFSSFDYKFNDINSLYSSDRKLRIISIKPIRGWNFAEIFFGLKSIYKAEKDYLIKEIKLFVNNGLKRLMEVKLVDNLNTSKYFSYTDGIWETKLKSEFDEIYSANKFETANVTYLPGGIKQSLKKFDISKSTDIMPFIGHREFLLTIPTLEFKFKYLELLTDNGDLVVETPLYNAIVYVYRSRYGYDFIEITSEKFVDGVFVRTLNLYYFRGGDGWEEIPQNVFFDRFKHRLINTLEEDRDRYMGAISRLATLESTDNAARVETNDIDMDPEDETEANSGATPKPAPGEQPRPAPGSSPQATPTPAAGQKPEPTETETTDAEANTNANSNASTVSIKKNVASDADSRKKSGFLTSSVLVSLVLMLI